MAFTASELRVLSALVGYVTGNDAVDRGAVVAEAELGQSVTSRWYATVYARKRGASPQSLSARSGLSVSTVRKALRTLAHDGYVSRHVWGGREAYWRPVVQGRTGL
jgi:hypothetical protein